MNEVVMPSSISVLKVYSETYDYGYTAFKSSATSSSINSSIEGASNRIQSLFLYNFSF